MLLEVIYRWNVAVTNENVNLFYTELSYLMRTFLYQHIIWNSLVKVQVLKLPDLWDKGFKHAFHNYNQQKWPTFIGIDDRAQACVSSKSWRFRRKMEHSSKCWTFWIVQMVHFAPELWSSSVMKSTPFLMERLICLICYYPQSEITCSKSVNSHSGVILLSLSR